jgi:hypothetical protein
MFDSGGTDNAKELRDCQAGANDSDYTPLEFPSAINPIGLRKSPVRCLFGYCIVLRVSVEFQPCAPHYLL